GRAVAGPRARLRPRARTNRAARSGEGGRREGARCRPRRARGRPRKPDAGPARAGRAPAPLADALMVEGPPTIRPADARREQEQALLHEVADAVGGLMEFWGFKRTMGRIWTTLYLSEDPLSAAALWDRLEISCGAASM